MLRMLVSTCEYNLWFSTTLSFSRMVRNRFGRPPPRSFLSTYRVKTTHNRMPAVGITSVSSSRRSPKSQPCSRRVSSFTPAFSATAASAASRPVTMLATINEVFSPK